jgi:EAL domain-containing protein (putative c-di-GMP-specific phosphodiesterase class I)
MATSIRNVELPMSATKKDGEDRVRTFPARIDHQRRRCLRIEQAVDRGLEDDKFRLAYQPIVDGDSRRIVGAEALLRLDDDELGSVSPEEFIPVAEGKGLIADIGCWVLERACAQVKAWRDSIDPALSVAVNLSPQQINAAFPDQVVALLRNNDLNASALELEITESMLLGDCHEVVMVLTALKEMGVNVSTDDFGTGYSSLSYLDRFPLHGLKIDKSFVSGLPDRREAAVITCAIVSIAHALGMRVTAEGVETSEQADFLRILGCERQQGYAYGRPMNPEDFAKAVLYPDRGKGCDAQSDRTE